MSLNQGDSFLYHYDFGDSWEHVLHLEKISDVTLTHPICIDGGRACPPEDCGGIWGYTDLLEVLKNPSDPEYDSCSITNIERKDFSDNIVSEKRPQ